MIVFPFWLLTAFLALMLKWTLNLSAFVLALPMLYVFGCGLYTLYCREWLQFFDFAGSRVWMLCVDFYGRFDCRCSRTF